MIFNNATCYKCGALLLRSFMKKIVSMFVFSLLLIAGSAQADENALTCQAQEHLSRLSDENLLQWNLYHMERHKNSSELENRLIQVGNNDNLPMFARVGNCAVRIFYKSITLSIESSKGERISDGSHSILEEGELNRETRELVKAERKAKTEEEKANIRSKLEEIRVQNVQQIQKVIDALRASLTNCEC